MNNTYYPSFVREINSIHGSGSTRPFKDLSVNSKTSVITNLFPKNKNISPPMYKIGVCKNPLDVGAERILKNDNNSRLYSDWYMSAQSTNPPLKTNAGEKKEKEEKDVKKVLVKNEKIKVKHDQLEPKYTNVVYPWKAYTWTYPILPNTDDYFLDNINSTSPDPIIVDMDNPTIGNYQNQYLNSNRSKEDYQNLDGEGYNTYTYTIILIILLIIIIKI